ncbi:MAG: terminase family protein [Acidobacteriaceae bacterium]|nr:terminase family protein [Acidobacteriaceae bacterium]MBV9500310.1 terminase family protein [Acidobacteriaceae bacterium]
MNPNGIADSSCNSGHLDELCWAYKPLPSQARFKAVRSRLKGFSGPVGSGKSAALSFEALRLSYINRGRQGVLAAPTYTMLRDATLASLLELLSVQEIEFERRKADGEIIVIRPDSVTLLRSLDEPERLRGTNLAWFGIDELSYSREEGWLRLEARLRDPKARRLCGLAVWTPQGHDWVYKRFIHNPIEGYECVQAKPFENTHVLGKTPDYYERLERSYDPRFYRQEVLGEYVNSRTDRVYHCFNQSVHMGQHQYDPKEPLMWALDFNVAPMSSILLQWKRDQLVVIDEIVLDRASTEEACLEFENRYKHHAAKIEIFGDASGRHMRTTGKTDYEILQSSLRRAGFSNVSVRVPLSNPPVMSRVHRVNALLTNALGEVRLEVNSRCMELIRDFEEVVFKPDSGVIDKNRDPKRSHVSDALGYAIWELFGEKPRAGEMDKRLF